MRKRVLHVLSSTSYAGAENVVISIINSLSGGFESAYASRQGDIQDVLEKNNITYFPIKRMSISEIRRITREFKPDIIHAHDYTASIVSAVSGVKASVVSHLHNNSPWIKTFHPYSFAYLISCIRYKKILAVSSSVFNEYVFGNLINKKSMVISNPIDISIVKNKSKQCKEDARAFDVLFIGRLSVSKNPLRFIELMHSVAKEYPNLTAAIIGEGELREECTAKIKRLGLENNVVMTGFMENPYKMLSKAKMLCITSNWEGFGLVAVEALSLGVPVVSASVGGLTGIVDSSCGMLCVDDEEFIDEIKKNIYDGFYRSRKSEGALAKSQRLNNIEYYKRNLSEIYSEC